MVREQLSSAGLETLRLDLSGRDFALVEQVAELRLMSTAQIRAVLFPAADHPSAVAAIRACNRCLVRLVEARALIRLERRIGGVRGGSSAAIFGLGPVGQRLIQLDGARRRFREPSAAFVEHTLAVSQLLVDLIVAARSKQFDLLALQAEPRCWRTFNGRSGRVLLRPDAYLSLGVGEYEYRFFVEWDTGSEHLPALLRKCHLYENYYASGKEQAEAEVFPRVVWLMPSTERAKRLRSAIVHSGQLTPALFVVVEHDQALKVLGGETA